MNEAVVPWALAGHGLVRRQGKRGWPRAHWPL